MNRSVYTYCVSIDRDCLPIISTATRFFDNSMRLGLDLDEIDGQPVAAYVRARSFYSAASRVLHLLYKYQVNKEEDYEANEESSASS